ncbi:hypothetical protein [Rhizobium lentis]|uniref:hypothetical protein n=1 Tax=Rhizobium lentis TaxID=1138194 RepID=UPI0017A870CC|nr:hypothetical protein [Rhizobium lentis]
MIVVCGIVSAGDSDSLPAEENFAQLSSHWHSRTMPQWLNGERIGIIIDDTGWRNTTAFDLGVNRLSSRGRYRRSVRRIRRIRNGCSTAAPVGKNVAPSHSSEAFRTAA